MPERGQGPQTVCDGFGFCRLGGLGLGFDVRCGLAGLGRRGFPCFGEEQGEEDGFDDEKDEGDESWYGVYVELDAEKVAHGARQRPRSKVGSNGRTNAKANGEGDSDKRQCLGTRFGCCHVRENRAKEMDVRHLELRVSRSGLTYMASWTLPSERPPTIRESIYEAKELDWIHLSAMSVPTLTV